MKLYWECSCGEQFQETGDRKGYSALTTHLWKHRKDELEGDGKCVGLYQADGEQLVAGQNIRKAILEGYVEPANKEKDTKDEQEGLKSTFKAKSKFVEIEIDPEILVLFYLTKGKFPSYGASIGEWISDCIVDYYNEHRELGLDVLLSNRPEIAENFIEKGV